MDGLVMRYFLLSGGMKSEGYTPYGSGRFTGWVRVGKIPRARRSHITFLQVSGFSRLLAYNLP
jgi:hypothetical protein